MRIMVSSKSGLNDGRRGRNAYKASTGNPVEDMLALKAQQQLSSPSAATSTPGRPNKANVALPIAIPDPRRRYGSPRSVQSSGSRSDASTSSKSSPQRASPSGSFYAGAKFSEAPSAASLPKPPSHWTSTGITVHHQHKDQFQEISNQLKMLLNIKA